MGITVSLEELHLPIMRSNGMLWVEYLAAKQIARQSTAWGDSVLGGMRFGQATTPAGIPIIAVSASTLDKGGEAICEIWHSEASLESGQYGAIHYRHSEQLLFGCLNRQEWTEKGDIPPLQTTTESAYQEIFELLAALGYKTVLRFWNYFPAINLETHGIDRYRQFNIGRQNAFLAHGYDVIGNVPAACTLGSDAGDLSIAFMATRQNVLMIENPRQVSAYHYPTDYGPRSPTFSRAGLVTLGAQTMLFISGTASIVGHQTQHHGDVTAQTRESIKNIDTVVKAARHCVPDADFKLSDLCYKGYIRHPEHLSNVRQEMKRYIGNSVQAVYLRADICRADLLVEIEATGGCYTAAH